MPHDPPPISPALAYTPGPREKLYNILLVVIDDLRADRLPPWNPGQRTAPNLSRRLEGSTVFEHCHSPVGWTLPGCASIATGHYPDSHGLVDHMQRFRRAKLGHYLPEFYRYGITNNGNTVTDTIPRATLERLGFERRPAKWRSFGWDDGFDRYDWFPRECDDAPFDAARNFLEEVGGSRPPREHTTIGSRPWFLFFHTNVVHDYHMGRPYYLSVRPFLGRELHTGLRSFRDGPEIWRERPEGLSAEEQSRQMLAKYEAGILHADRKLEELLARVDFAETIVIFMSDHGEGFEPELGRVHHCGRLNDDLTHVPLVVWLPPDLAARYQHAAVEPRVCSTVDVVPTVLTLLGDAVAGFPGRFLYDLPTHRRLLGQDRGYLYWNEDCVRESYDTCRIEILSERTYPLKEIRARKNDTLREYAYNLAYDPGEKNNLLATPATRIANFEPVSFVVAVNDEEELHANLLSSPVAHSRDHEWILVDNSENGRFASISALYQDALERASNDLVFFVHQDVLLPHGWERRMFDELAELERRDPDWGVLGAVGALPPSPDGQAKVLRGRWCDPSGYHHEGPLPHEVQALDEQWIGVRRRNGLSFDPALPGFHCYGIDISLAAREAGLRSWAIDAFVWHKYRDSRGYLVQGRDDSAKIQRRWSPEFMAEFQPSADYVEKKWKQYLPFQTTSWNWVKS